MLNLMIFFFSVGAALADSSQSGHPNGFKRSELEGRESLRPGFAVCPAVNPHPHPRTKKTIYDCPPENICADTTFKALNSPKIDLNYVPPVEGDKQSMNDSSAPVSAVGRSSDSSAETHAK